MGWTKRNRNNFCGDNCFDELFNELYPQLVFFANKYVGDYPLSEEIVQEVFVRFWLKRDSLEHESLVKSYLYRSVRNSSIDYLRRDKVERQRYNDYIYTTDNRTELKDIISENELKLKIEIAVSQLPEQCKKIFLMSREEEMTYKEIAADLNLSVKTVEAHISRALKSLREQLEEYLVLLFLHVKSLRF
jgi:RNA polymerase sigma-70 factor (ECF subfamily)